MNRFSYWVVCTAASMVLHLCQWINRHPPLMYFKSHCLFKVYSTDCRSTSNPTLCSCWGPVQTINLNQNQQCNNAYWNMMMMVPLTSVVIFKASISLALSFFLPSIHILRSISYFPLLLSLSGLFLGPMEEFLLRSYKHNSIYVIILIYSYMFLNHFSQHNCQYSFSMFTTRAHDAVKDSE